jgi:nitrogenase molybdenum-iron protein alpha/beta subunit
MAPDLFSTGLQESDIVFGGEKALERALVKAADRGVHAIFVLSTCIVDTIGDDVDAVCTGDYGVPVIHVPTAGFLGGTFQDGLNRALIALAGTAGPCPEGRGVNIIGEMNLEYEVGANYAEVSRLLSGLGLEVNLRFVHAITYEELSLLGAARLNILRNPSLLPVGEYLQKRFGTPFIPSFPHGLSDTLSFIRSVADACGIDGACAADREKILQEEMIASFSDLRRSAVVFDTTLSGPEGTGAAQELVAALGLSPGNGCGRALPVSPAVGTAGTRRMLHRWRRAIHA